MSLRLGGGGATGRKGGADDRMKKYKAGVDVDEGRRRREEGLVEIRKTRRGDSLAKKRREVHPSAGAAALSLGPSADGVRMLAADLRSAAHGAGCQRHGAGPSSSQSGHAQLEKISEMAQQLWSEDFFVQLDATKYFRELLSIGQNPPIDMVIRAGIVPRMVQFLLRQDKPKLQLEAAWTLTNVASEISEHTQIIIKHGALPILVQLLSSPNEEVQEQAVWALGNVAGDSPSCRDLVLESGILIPLLSLLNPQSRLSMLRNATWTLSNLFRGKPSVQIEQVKPALPILRQLIYSNDDDILANACWALSFLSNGAHDRIQAVINADVCPRLVELLRHSTPSVLISALRTVGNIVTGDDAQTQFVIDNGLLFCLRQLLTQYHPNKIKKEACWIISNITAGSKAQIQAVFDTNIIPPLLHLLEHAEFNIKKEAAWAMSNAIRGGSFEQIHFLASQGCIKLLCDLLTCPDSSILMLCLESLENILKAGEAAKDLGNNDGINLYVVEVEDRGGLDKIEKLQGHDNSEIYRMAIEILEKYWDEEEDEEGENSQGIGEGMDHGFNLA